MARVRRSEQVGRNREAVLDAAWRVFVDRGYTGASLEAIADEAGFSKGVVYSQFGSKADLFLALLERRIELRAVENERIVDRWSGEPVEAIGKLLLTGGRATGRGWSQALIEFRTVASRDPELGRRYAAAHRRTVDHLAALLRRLHERAGTHPDVEVRSLAQLVLAVDSGFTLERLADPDALPVDDVVTMVVRSLGLRDAMEVQR